jgi:hypothetical protein
MAPRKSSLTWRVRSAFLLTAVAAGVLHVDGAVLPLADDLLGGAGVRAGLLAPKITGVAGQWVGRTSSGGIVSIVLRVDGGAVAGDATLDGIVPEAKAGPRPLVAPTVTGRTMAFAVQPGPCAKSLARGIVTFVSQESAYLDLQAGPNPISVRLTKVG